MAGTGPRDSIGNNFDLTGRRRGGGEKGTSKRRFTLITRSSRSIPLRSFYFDEQLDERRYIQAYLAAAFRREFLLLFYTYIYIFGRGREFKEKFKGGIEITKLKK